MDIYENYINIGLGAGTQTVAKIRQFEKNYNRFSPTDKEAGILDIGPGKGEIITANIFLYDDFTHETGYTERSLTQLLTLSGFTSVQCFVRK